jgi:hypothetical protein
MASWARSVRRGAAAAAAVAAAVPATSAAHDIPASTLNAFTDPAIGTPANNDQPATMGRFDAPITEPTIDGKATDKKCVQKPGSSGSLLADDPYLDCKPAGVSVNVLPGSRVMYYDGLEGTENIRTSIVLEYGHNAGNDQSRLLDLNGPSWRQPGTGPVFPAYQNHALFPPPLSSTEDYNDDALFCSDNKFLADGRIIATGGSGYYNDPGFQAGNSNYGVSELEGLQDARIYDPRTNAWSRSGPMHIGRWYPTAITLADGHLFVASGVEKLVKPAYPDRPAGSGSNVTETETYDPVGGKWAMNPDSAKKSLPLYPRLHLLPDGKVFYNAAGQAFNPFGQSYDEALWNEASVYDPKAQTWRDIGVPGAADGPPPDVTQNIGNPAGDAQSFGIPGGGRAFVFPGFRGSTFSLMLPLRPDARGRYSKASFLTAGGVLNPPSPGSYFATSDSRVTTIDTAANDSMTTRAVDDLSQPRWYGSGVMLPTGQVLTFSGSDRDEVAGPGVEIPIKKAELFDPATGKWRTLASAHQPRTYHNSAALLPDGRILIGGHAPISTLYASDITLPGGVTAPNDGRDPSFEVYRPPYLYWSGRPKIRKAPRRIDYGRRLTVTVKGRTRKVKSVVLVRNPSVTHLVDADQRNVELRVIRRRGHKLTLAAPPNGAVAPPGPYMLFVNGRTKKGLVPSVSRQTYVGLKGVRRDGSAGRSRP